MRFSKLLSLLLSLPVALTGAPVPFRSPQHQISAVVPDGWDQVQGLTESTVLKLARSGSGPQKALIALVLQDLPAGAVPPGTDLWNLSDDEIRKASASDVPAGEPVTVLNVGRGAVDGLHTVWSKTRRTAPNGATVWGFVYEGIRGSQHLTVRLTSVGDEDWFTANQAIFAEFMRTLRLSAAGSAARGEMDASAGSPVDHLKQQLRGYSDAFVARDLETLTHLMPATLLEVIGGADEAKKYHERAFASLQASGLDIRGVTLAEPSPIVTENAESFSIVPTTLQATLKGGTATVTDYLVAISSDGGKRWGFVSGGAPIERLLRSYPTVSAALTIPARRMTVTRPGSDLRIESVYQNGAWVPTEETKRALEKLMKRAKR